MACHSFKVILKQSYFMQVASVSSQCFAAAVRLQAGGFSAAVPPLYFRLLRRMCVHLPSLSVPNVFTLVLALAPCRSLT